MLIQDIENKYENETILLILHGDPLKFLETYFHGISPPQYRSLTHLDIQNL
jgi:broad specificity phosphatase PhoE